MITDTCAASAAVMTAALLAKAVQSGFSATGIHLFGQFLMTVCGRGRHLGQPCGTLFARGLPPFFMAPHSGSPPIFFGTMLAFAAIGAVVPIVLGKEMIARVEVIGAETVAEYA